MPLLELAMANYTMVHLTQKWPILRSFRSTSLSTNAPSVIHQIVISIKQPLLTPIILLHLHTMLAPALQNTLALRH